MMNCVHPMRMVNTMKRFADAVGLTADIDHYKWSEETDLLETITIETPIEYVIRKHQQFAVSTDDVDDWGVCYLRYNLAESENSTFAPYWHEQFPELKEFANITLALLHELGHVATRNETFYDEDGEIFDRDFSMMMLGMFPDPIFASFAYYEMPDEKAATMWAINWLNDTEHQKIAKEFEKKFFACFE